MSRRFAAAVAIVAVAPLAGGCADFEEEAATAVVQSALDSSKKQSTARQLAQIASEDCQMTAEQAALEAAAAPVAGLYPASCVTKTVKGVSVHAEYDGCTGAFGYADIKGGLDATFEAGGDCTYRADITDSGDLTNHGKLHTYDAVADVVVLPGARDVTWNAQWTGSNVLNQSIEQAGKWQYLYTLSTGCYDFGGSAEGKLDGTPYDYTISDLSICEHLCPSKGTLKAHWGNEYELSAEFDGSAVAKVTGWSGRQFEVELVCTPIAETPETE